MWDRRVPFVPKLLMVASIVYLLLPVDMLPEAALGLAGLLDDLAIMGLAAAWLLLRAPQTTIDDETADRGDGREP